MITLDSCSFVGGSPWTSKQHKLFLLKLSSEIAHTVTITINMVDATAMQGLNKQYRHKDYPTNILSFTYDTTPTDVVGELILCPEIIATEAQEQALNINQHYAHLLVHGILHLLGYDHETDEQALIMEALEKKCLLALDYDAP